VIPAPVVIPANAGTHGSRANMDPGVRRDDGLA